ncbi:Undecaprenyl-diphosphatase [Candidatus Izimaplasma bacterium HR1]|jgi:undecaprenyl-diphosphatase|uniref:undecaprenyl-diphosphate phosphatase n=1 Tax=Candidatus Izimoplasma sp. HR1 TaxID=1541959 RepID=UPI0004F5AAA0|nr:Undecaprenyl-diphosphatase [Candidatus Izimaplasma bacterium HR1]
MKFIEIIKTIIIGIVEGITEWLPISSTGHMILVDEWIKLDVSPEFMEMFLVVIQLGAILAVVVLFFNKLNPLAFKKTKEERNDIWQIWFKVLIGVIPAAIIGLLLDEWLYNTLYNYITVAIMLVVYGVLFIVIENKNKGKKATITSFNDLSYKTAFLIGMFQVLALIPGTSRSGATILGAVILGTSRFIAAEFSFFLSIPVMFGASFIKILDFGFNFTGSELIILITGMVTAFIISIITIKFLLGYIKKHDFKVFGWYRIILGVIVIVYFLVPYLVSIYI